MWVLGISAVQKKKKRFTDKNARRLLSHCTVVRGLQGRARLGGVYLIYKINADVSCPDKSDIESQNHLGWEGP